MTTNNDEDLKDRLFEELNCGVEALITDPDIRKVRVLDSDEESTIEVGVTLEKPIKLIEFSMTIDRNNYCCK